MVTPNNFDKVSTHGVNSNDKKYPNTHFRDKSTSKIRKDQQHSENLPPVIIHRKAISSTYDI